EDGRDASLRITRVRLVARALGDQRDGAVLRRVEGERKTGDPAADDEKIAGIAHKDLTETTLAGSLTHNDDAVRSARAFFHSSCCRGAVAREDPRSAEAGRRPGQRKQ